MTLRGYEDFPLPEPSGTTYKDIYKNIEEEFKFKKEILSQTLEIKHPTEFLAWLIILEFEQQAQKTGLHKLIWAMTKIT